MAQFNIAVNAKVNQPPSQLGTRTQTTLNRTNYVFVQDDFTVTVPPYIDPDGDDPQFIRIRTLPSSSLGTLEYNSIPVVIDQDITWADIASGLLVYIPANQDAEYTEGFVFDIADVGSGQVSGLTDLGIFNITAQAYINQPPSAVGTNTVAAIAHSSTRVFTVADFTTDTVPAYADPEGDAADLLKITTVPSEGVLLLNGVQVVVNQIITFTDIGAGNFTYFANGDNAGYTAIFDFEIADAGSGQFSS